VIARGDDRVHVRLGGKLDMVIRSDGLLATAETLLVSIRPEKIHIEKQPPAGDYNVFEAEIAEEFFKGATDELTLRHESGLELIAVAANESAHQDSFSKGEKVFCSIHPSDVVVVQEE
jgi:ABC-type Fe3+/spermidine/putrescine transport system ATPase subunit